MNDDQLANELRRRAGRADVPDLLPAVRSAIDTRPQQPAALRWAPLAGLAGAAAVLVLLIVSLPRLTPGAESTPPVTAAPSAAMPAAVLHDCGSVWKVTYGPSPVFVVDDTGTVRSCAAEPRVDQWPAGAADLIVQTVGDAADEIEVAWRRTELCSPERILVELSSTSAGFAIRLILDRSGPYGYECVGLPHVAEHAVLALATPIDPARVSVELVTVPDPDVPTRTFDCAPAEPVADRSPAPGAVPQLVDHTGVAAGCRQIEAGAPVQAGVAVTNLSGFDSVRFDWVDTTCDGQVEADFRGAVDGYRLAVKQPVEACAPTVPVAIVVDYQIPMPSELVTADFEQPPPVVACTDTPGVTVVDEVGVVRSCVASVSTASPGSDVVFDNPGGDTSALQVSWAAGSQCTYEVHLQPGDGYTIQIYNMSTTCPLTDVVRTVTLHLTTPIDVNEITGWSIGGPPPSPPPGPSFSPSQPPPSSTPDPSPTTTAINFTTSSFGVGEGTADSRVDLEASVIVTVR